jgi:hypothetical protein
MSIHRRVTCRRVYDLDTPGDATIRRLTDAPLFPTGEHPLYDLGSATESFERHALPALWRARSFGRDTRRRRRSNLHRQAPNRCNATSIERSGHAP